MRRIGPQHKQHLAQLKFQQVLKIMDHTQKKLGPTKKFVKKIQAMAWITRSGTGSNIRKESPAMIILMTCRQPLDLERQERLPNRDQDSQAVLERSRP